MAKVYIAEYSTAVLTGTGGLPAPKEPPIAEQTVNIGASSVQSAAFNVATRYIRINTDAICSLAFGPDPTATANNQRFAANQTEYKGVNPGQKVAVITNS